MTDVVTVNGYEERAVLQLAASAERGSEHPLGRAIVERAEAQDLGLWEPLEFQAVRDGGHIEIVQGGGARYRLGWAW